MLRVLMYHRVAIPELRGMLHPRLISATPAGFDRQMEHVAEAYTAVTMEDVLSAVATGKELPPRAVLITFDDAYRDFAEVAWPILRRYHLPATLFVPTAYPGHPERAFWWDRLFRAFMLTKAQHFEGLPSGAVTLSNHKERWAAMRALQAYAKTLPHEDMIALVDDVCERLGAPEYEEPSVLDWDELRSLHRDGVTLGAHTCVHPLLTRVDQDRCREEIARSQHDLEREVGSALPIFCYPGGDHDDRVVDIVRDEGFEVAFTVLDGQNQLGKIDPLRLRRTGITQKTTPAVFRLRLNRWVSYIDMWRHRARAQ